MIYDVQDVGVRFYTYINVLRDVMESCLEFKKELLILDRPNPNGYLIDGPDTRTVSFTMLHSKTSRNQNKVTQIQPFCNLT